MTVILKRDAKQIRAVFRKALGRSARNAVVNFRASQGVLCIYCLGAGVGIAWHLCGNWEDDQFAIPLDAFNDFAGHRDDGVHFDNQGEKILVRWSDGDIPRVVEQPGLETQDPPLIPGELASNDERFLRDLAEAHKTTDAASARYALGCIRLRGSDGQLAATDGRQAIMCHGFEFPWEDNVLARSNAVFGLKELQRQSHVEVGKLEDHVYVAAGPWRVWLAIEKDSRFPDVDGNVPSVSAAASTLTLNDSDAEFLENNLKRLPGGDVFNSPVTVDLNGAVAIRGQEPEQQRVTELTLTNSQRAGEDVCFNSNREYLARAAKMGMRHFYFHGPKAPAVARDARRIYVWAVLGPDGVIEPSENTTRITSQTATSTRQDSQQSRQISQPPSNERNTPTTMTQPQTNGKATKTKTNTKTNSTATKEEGPAITHPITAAETLRDQLREATSQANLLVRLLKRRKKESKLVATTLESLKRLQSVES